MAVNAYDTVFYAIIAFGHRVFTKLARATRFRVQSLGMYMYESVTRMTRISPILTSEG